MADELEAPLMQEHEVLLIDFLGFSAAVESWSDAKLEQLIEVLIGISNAQSAFDIKGEAQADGSYKISSPAEITSFSDHVVISYPRLAKPADISDELWPIIADSWSDMVRQQMQRITAQMVMAALDLGLLVRGGLSRGKLFHRGSVVVGEAMIDAHRLESKVAKGARVAVSERIENGDRLFTDTDGVSCLDYLAEVMILAEDRHGNAKAWAEARMVEIEASIKTLTGSGQPKEAAKWAEFREKLRYQIDTWP